MSPPGLAGGGAGTAPERCRSGISSVPAVLTARRTGVDCGQVGIAVLGPVTWDGSASLSPRDRVVLAVLATHPGHPVAPDRIADALWGDTPPATAGKVLQGCIARLRKVMGKEAIETSTQGYALTLPADEIDSLQFERLVMRGRELLTLGEVDRAAYLLTQALALWRGDAFADVESWPPAADEAKRLGELRLEAQELRVDAHLRAGRHGEVLAEAQALVRAAPLRERRWSLLALAQYQSGAQGEALRTIHQLKSVLARQLGIDAGPRGDGPRAGDPAPGPLAAHRPGAGAVGGDLPVAGTQAVRRGRRRPVLRPGRTTWTPAWRSCAGPRCWSWSDPRAAGSPRSCMPGSRPRCGDGAGPPSRSRRAPTRCRRSPRWARTRTDTVLLVDQFEELFSLCDDVDGAAGVPRRADGGGRRADRGPGAARRPPGRHRVQPGVQPARRAGALPRGRARGARPAPGDRGPGPAGGSGDRARPGRRAGAARSRTTPAPCRCSRTPCWRPGSAGRATP